MAEIKAVKEPEASPKAVKTRRQSGVAFPYQNLARSIEVARVMHAEAGGSCTRSQLAVKLKYSGTKNGAFLSRVAAARMFGLIEQEDEILRVSARGRAIVAEVSETQSQRAKVDAFLAVELFKKVYELYDGQILPPEVGLRNLLETTYNVVKDRVAPTVEIMLDSAEQAGFFKAAGNRTRMVMPLLSGSQAAKQPAISEAAAEQSHADRGNGGDGGGGGGGDDFGHIDPAILGLLKRLPPGGTPLSSKRRKALIDAFTATVGFIYPDEEEQKETI